MKVSEALDLKSRLAELAVDTSYITAIDEYILKLNTTLDMFPQQGGGYLKSIKRVCDDTVAAARQIHGPVIDVMDNMDSLIRQLEPELYKQSFDAYVANLFHLDEESVLSSKMNLTEEWRHDLEFRIKSFSHWKYAGLIIRPGLENFLPQVVDCDPMYLADQSTNLLLPIVTTFPELYRDRVRMVNATENLSGQPFLTAIPEAQIGFCFAFHFFNFKPMEIIEQYFKEIYVKLKPGGIFVFTFNNCSRPFCADLAERKLRTYTPYDHVIRILLASGFKLLNTIEDHEELCWIECVKPGEFTSIRGGQVLGKLSVVPKVVAQVDRVVEVVYTSEIVSMLQEITISLSLDQPMMIKSGKYTPQTLDKMIRKKLSIRTGQPLTQSEIEKLYNERNNL